MGGERGGERGYMGGERGYIGGERDYRGGEKRRLRRGERGGERVIEEVREGCSHCRELH